MKHILANSVADVESSVSEAGSLGYVVTHVGSYESFCDFVQQFGKTVNITTVKADPTRSARLSSSKSMSLHTDHPEVDWIAWYCVSEANDGGESLLLDSRKVLAEMDSDTVQNLRRIKVKAPLPNRQFAINMLLSDERIVYAEWLVEKPADPAIRLALEKLQESMAVVPYVNLSLRSGDALVIDNRWMLHGRNAFNNTVNCRELLRHWICIDGV